MSSDQPTYQTTTTSSAPWSGQQPYLSEGFERAKTDILNTPTQYYPNSTVVPLSGQTEQSLAMQEQRALAGSPVTAAAQEMAQKTLSGDYLQEGNPYLQSAIDAATRPAVQTFQEDIIPGIQSGFSSAGRFGSGLQARQQERAGETAAREVGDIASQMAYENYAQERQRQLQAGTLAPTLAAQDYADIQQLANVGAVREGQAGAQLKEDINRFYQQQNAPKDALAQYMSLVAGGSYGSESSAQKPIYSNTAGDVLGGAATAAGIAGTLFGQGGIWPQ